MNVNDNLKILRKNFNYMQKDIAEKLKISISAYSAWELGRNQPGANELIKLADIYGCSVDYLLGREGEDGTIFVMGNELSKSENKLLDMVRQLHDDDKDTIYKLVESILLSYKIKK